MLRNRGSNDVLTCFFRLCPLRSRTSGGGDFFRFQNDVLPVICLITFDLIVTLDQLAGLAIYELALHPIVGCFVERVEGDPLLTLRPKRDCAGHFAEFDEAFPIRSRGTHNMTLLTEPRGSTERVSETS